METDGVSVSDWFTDTSSSQGIVVGRASIASDEFGDCVTSPSGGFDGGDSSDC